MTTEQINEIQKIKDAICRLSKDHDIHLQVQPVLPPDNSNRVSHFRLFLGEGFFSNDGEKIEITNILIPSDYDYHENRHSDAIDEMYGMSK
jgi:hypothetical protein